MKEVVAMIKDKIQEMIISIITLLVTYLITEKQRENLLKSELDKLIKK
jgi:hypothetical protein